MNGTYVDAVGAVRDWVNSRTERVVGPGNPLQKGAYLRDHEGTPDKCYAVLSLIPGTAPGGAAESPMMIARISASIYGPTIEAITYASMALADELVNHLAGQRTTVREGEATVQLWVADDISGPSDLPDGNLPRHLLDFTVIMQPAPIG